MATQTVKLQIAATERKNRNARIWAYLALFVFLSFSMAANVLTAWEYDIVAKIVAGVPPVSLFVTSMLFERMVANRWIKAGMVLTIVVSLAFSWYHIAELALDSHQPWFIALFLPVVIDVPMLFAGTVLLRQAKQVTLPETSRIRAIVTTPVKRTKVATTPKTAKTIQVTPKPQVTPKHATLTTSPVTA